MWKLPLTALARSSPRTRLKMSLTVSKKTHRRRRRVEVARGGDEADAGEADEAGDADAEEEEDGERDPQGRRGEFTATAGFCRADYMRRKRACEEPETQPTGNAVKRARRAKSPQRAESSTGRRYVHSQSRLHPESLLKCIRRTAASNKCKHCDGAGTMCTCPKCKTCKKSQYSCEGH